jgi:hypothetical protein
MTKTHKFGRVFGRMKRLVGRIKRRRSIDSIIKRCGCVCFCPKCKEPLNDQADCVDTDLVRYHCNACGTDSEWNFDIAPCPILVTSNATGDKDSIVKKRLAAFACTVRRFVGQRVWKLCWKTPLARWNLFLDVGTMVWVWAYRDYTSNAEAETSERGEV